MRRSPVPVAVVVLAVLLVAVLGYALWGTGAGKNLDSAVQRGEQPVAPEASLQLPVLGGTGTKSLAQLRGKIVVVNVWASWCEPCKSEAPLISAVNKALVKSGEGQVLGVTHVDPSSKSIAFAKENGLDFESVRDVDETLYRAFGSTGTPETYVINREGKVAALARTVVDASFMNRALEAAGAKARVPDSTPDATAVPSTPAAES
jgi:cytochrome c biogenesis protein CcmG/thiol:disulfide interchange protein DsbE